MNTANKGKNLVINYNTYFISSNIIFISESSSEWVSELRFNVPPTSRLYGDGTSVIIIKKSCDKLQYIFYKLKHHLYI